MAGALQRQNEILTAPLDDSLLMMSVKQGLYFELQGVGGRIWELLAEPTSERTLIETLVAEFEVTPEACAVEVAAFLDDLRSSGLLIEAGQG